MGPPYRGSTGRPTPRLRPPGPRRLAPQPRATRLSAGQREGRSRPPSAGEFGITPRRLHVPLPAPSPRVAKAKFRAFPPLLLRCPSGRGGAAGEPHVISQVPAHVVRVLIDRDLAAIAEPAITEANVEVSHAEIESAEPEASRAPACQPPDTGRWCGRGELPDVRLCRRRYNPPKTARIIRERLANAHVSAGEAVERRGGQLAVKVKSRVSCPSPFSLGPRHNARGGTSRG